MFSHWCKPLVDRVWHSQYPMTLRQLVCHCKQMDHHYPLDKNLLTKNWYEIYKSMEDLWIREEFHQNYLFISTYFGGWINIDACILKSFIALICGPKIKFNILEYIRDPWAFLKKKRNKVITLKSLINEQVGSVQ